MDEVKSKGSTIYDVAALAKVSISTVSLALNAPDRVKPATLRRIMDAVDECGFTPKAEAVIRARRGVGRIGVIAPFTSSPAESVRRLAGIFRGVGDAGSEVVVFDQASAATSRLMSLPVSKKVDGLIVVSLPFSDDVRERLLEQSTPTVVVEILQEDMSNVLIDHRGGGALVGRRFAEHGHERCAFVGQIQQHDYRSQSLEQQLGYRSVLGDDVEVVNIDSDLDSAISVGHQLLDRRDRPTAILAHDDLMAAGVLRAARRLGVSVPDDLEIVGFNDSDLAAPLGLSSVAQPFEESGELAAKLLLEQIAGHDVSRRTVLLDVALVDRDTTRRAT